jgi:hypothetical protein
MNSKVAIILTDELEDKVIRANAILDMESGAIEQPQYLKYNVDVEGPPYKRKDYEFTNGKLSSNGREVEFTVKVDKVKGRYSVSVAELLEIESRLAAK